MKTYQELMHVLHVLEKRMAIYQLALGKLDAVQQAKTKMQVMKMLSHAMMPAETLSEADQAAYDEILKPALQSYFKLKRSVGDILPNNPAMLKDLKSETEKELVRIRRVIQSILEEAVEDGIETYKENAGAAQKVSSWLEEQKEFINNRDSSNPAEWLQGEITKERRVNAVSSNLSALWGKVAAYDRASLHGHLEACRSVLFMREC